MTLLVPLNCKARPPSRPAFVAPVNDPVAFTLKVVRAIVKARRIAVVCGAGISVQAGIPDFRSSDGLFQRIKRENPKENLSSGKDLFDASVFNAEHTTALFCQMIARLSRLSLNATPTSFHTFLRDLDERGKLLRVYTQNIDALEEKAGLTFGLPNYGSRGRGKARTGKGTKVADDQQSSTPCDTASISSGDSSGPAQTTDTESMNPQTATASNETPRCIPLHGTLQSMHCVSCSHSYPLSDHSDCLDEGSLPDCPDCIYLEETRSMIGKRPRGIGKLRPSVVLYNEDHSNGEGVGEAVRRDLLARTGADLLIVVGTSLRVPGTKRIVREFAKAVKAKERARAERAHEIAWSKRSLPTPTPSPSSTPAPSPRRTPIGDPEGFETPSPPPLPNLPPEERPISTVYINLDFPVPTREWDSVFDVWIQGDAQVFAELVRDEMEREEKEKVERLEREERAKEERKEREERRRRDKEEKERMKQEAEVRNISKPNKGTKKVSKKGSLTMEGKVNKRRRVTLRVNSPRRMLPTPRSTSKPSVSVGFDCTGESCASESAGATSHTLQRATSPSKSRLNILSSLASQSPHAYRRRSVPDVVIPTSSYRFGGLSLGCTEQNGKGKAKEVQRESALDLLANAAATLSITPPPNERTVYVYDGLRQRTESSSSKSYRLYSNSGDFGHDSHVTPRSYQALSPPDSRAQSHSRPRSISRSSRDQYPDYFDFDSPLSSVSSLTSIPSPVMRTSSTPSRKPARITSSDLDRSLYEGHVPSPPIGYHSTNHRSNIGNLLNPPFEYAPPHNERVGSRDNRNSDVPITPTKRKPDSASASPKAPPRVKKVKLNIRRPNAPMHHDVDKSPNSHDKHDKEASHTISPKSSRDRCSLDSTEFHMSETEADAPLLYAFRSPRQEVLCN